MAGDKALDSLDKGCKLCSPPRKCQEKKSPRKQKRNDNPTQCIKAGQSKHWFLGLMTSTLHTCKVGASYVCPGVVSFSMSCSAHLQASTLEGGRTFGLAVVLSRENSTLQSVQNTEESVYKCVGGSLQPRNVPAGSVIVRLVSRDFEADIKHGEDPNLVKREDDFRGRDFEKQFACAFKDAPVTEGVIGKVVIESVQASGVTHTLFEFNISVGFNKSDKNEIVDTWSALAMKELAYNLQATANDYWGQLAKCLGFTDHEVQTQLGRPSGDPFEELVRSYQDRGGSPEEFAAAMQQVAKNDVGGRLVISRRAVWEEEEEQEEEVQQVQCTLPFQLVSGQTLCTTLPLTPPPTPRKRKLLSPSGNISPTKCRRLFSDDVTPTKLGPVFVFPEPPSEPDDHVHRECPDALPSNVMWQVSAHVHQKWKCLGRTLNVPETELMCIEHAANRDLRECTYQVLLKWQDMFPQNACYGVLYTALCECGLRSVAQKCCVVTELQSSTLLVKN